MMATVNKLIIGIAVASFTIFQLLFHVLSSWASTRITPAFNNLSQKRKIEWNSRTVSSFHALVVGAFCVYILLYDDAVNADHVWGDPSIVKLNIAITTGYLISDLFLITYYWKAIGDKYFVIHHLAALYAYYFVLGEGILAYFGNFRLLAEFSTPFVNQRDSGVYEELKGSRALHVTHKVQTARGTSCAGMAQPARGTSCACMAQPATATENSDLWHWGNLTLTVEHPWGHTSQRTVITAQGGSLKCLVTPNLQKPTSSMEY
ncbi:TLC domain-containing protein 4 isoform X4 [Pelodiscus sinensis]|uniref:TLC domain-containing protein 4 isoform X4 n=1 Tax=Pelodiscus sinensis TaxID=13735 RepID=UPI003F6C9690